MIYFDNAATTKPSKSALIKAEKFNNESFFNPSTLYRGGLNCANEIKNAKQEILTRLGVNNNNYQVIFTSCGSESDNTAIFCSVKKGVFVTDNGEHAAVYKPFMELKNKGQQVHFISLNKDGSVNQNELYNFIKNNRVDFVSIVHVNNETGAINDINLIADNIKKINKNIVFHSDGVQAFGKILFRLSENVDLYSISAHKINGIKGVGALIKNKKTNISPLIYGGGQESGLRSGTENLFGIKVFEYAVKEKFENLTLTYQSVKNIKNYLIDNLDKDIFTIISGENSSPYILSVSAKGLRGEVIMHALEDQDIIVGNGSACSSKNRYSRVIEGCGYNNEIADGVVRLSFSAENTLSEAKFVADKLNAVAKKLKGITL